MDLQLKSMNSGLGSWRSQTDCPRRMMPHQFFVNYCFFSTWRYMYIHYVVILQVLSILPRMWHSFSSVAGDWGMEKNWYKRSRLCLTWCHKNYRCKSRLTVFSFFAELYSVSVLSLELSTAAWNPHLFKLFIGVLNARS